MNCQCGCGKATPIAKKTRAHLGHVKGEPVSYHRGHNSQPGVQERFWAKVRKTDGCWLWTGSHNGLGYGTIRSVGRKMYVHRYSYELLVGPIPAGLELDHLCRVPGCVNPDHLEPVTHAENLRRGRLARAGL